MLKLAVLGLLQRESLHGYGLTKDLELFMGCCMTINSGAVYPLLRRLEERRDISASESQDSASSRIVYCITDQGRQRWLDEMRSHPNESWVNSRVRFMIKVFFFQDLLPQYRAELLEHRLMQCRLKQQRIQDEKAARTSLDAYQLATFHHGTQLLTMEVEWLSQLLAAELPAARQVHQLLNDTGEPL